MIVFGESILIQWLSYFIFSLILLIVVILHYRDAKRIWILTANSHLEGHSDLSAFSYKDSLLKKVYKQKPF